MSSSGLQGSWLDDNSTPAPLPTQGALLVYSNSSLIEENVTLSTTPKPIIPEFKFGNPNSDIADFVVCVGKAYIGPAGQVNIDIQVDNGDGTPTTIGTAILIKSVVGGVNLYNNQNQGFAVFGSVLLPKEATQCSIRFLASSLNGTGPGGLLSAGCQVFLQVPTDSLRSRLLVPTA